MKVDYDEERDFRPKDKSLFQLLDLPMARHEIVRNDTGKIVDFKWLEVNDSYLDFYNAERDDFVGQSASKAHPEMLDLFLEVYKEEDGYSIHTSFIGFFEKQNKYVELKILSEEKNCFTIYFVDVTEHVLIERELKRSEERMNDIFSTVPMRIFWKDLDCVYQGSNRPFAEDAGVGSPENIVGKTDYDLAWQKEEAEAFIKDDREVMASGKAKLYFEETQKHADGIQSWLRTSKIPLFDENGKVNGVLGTYEDITVQKETELKVKKSEQHLKTTLNSIGEAVIVTDREGTIQIMNPVAEQLTGYLASEVLSEDIAKVFSIVDVKTEEHLMNPIVAVVKENSIQSCHDCAVLLSKEKQRYYISYTASPIYDEDEHIYGVVLIFRDRTQNYEDQRRMQFMKFTLEQVDMEVLWAHGDGTFIYANETARRKMGYALEEILELDISFLNPNFSLEKWHLLWQRLQVEKYISFESTHLAKNGEVWPVQVFLNYVVYEGKEYALAFFHDISEKKQAENLLKVSQDRQNALFASMNEMVCYLKVKLEEGKPVDFTITECNEAFLKLTSLGREDVVGKDTREVFKVNKPPYFKEYMNVFKSKIHNEFISYDSNLDKHFHISAVPLSEDQIALLISDVSEIKQIEEILRSKNKELENYLYVASHDMRSPLVNIQGFSQRLQKQVAEIDDFLSASNCNAELLDELKDSLEKKIPQTMDFIFTNVSKMNSLIDGLLQISRTGRARMEIRKVDLNMLMTQVLKVYNYEFEENDVEVEMEDLPFCYGDEALLNSLFSNLISNAYKYRHKERNLKIRITGKHHYFKTIIGVQDNGIGIQERHMNRIWDVFYRVDPMSAGEGEGLGLSIVKRIVDKHKGDICVESQEMVGSAFYVTLMNKKFQENN